MLIGWALAILTFFEPLILTYSWHWLTDMLLSFRLDQVSKVLILLVYTISTLVHVFSAFYLQEDPGLNRYYFKLGFFTTSMIGLLAADHLLLVFGFWELVGFSSYLLIGFWFSDPQKAAAAKAAFMINRVADAALMIGVILMVFVLDQANLSFLSYSGSTPLMVLAGFGLLIGAMGKSAQFPFMGWLPKAMAGPTPVSALIHAATMVAAGVYLLYRVAPVLPPVVMNVAVIVGALTAFMAAYAALTQFDIKSVLAYSTISQLGYMVMGIGAGAWEASLFHLWTHAFFKAGLFLAAGSVIHYMHTVSHQPDFDPQDMRNMSGLRKKLPVTFGAFVIMACALAGLPFFSGFLSKEAILSGLWVWSMDMGGLMGVVPLILALAATFMTPLYIFRQLYLVFLGKSETSPAVGVEPLITVKIPLIFLAIGSLWFFHAVNPFNAHGWYLHANLLFTQGAEAASELMPMLLALGLSGLGLITLFMLRNHLRPKVNVEVSKHTVLVRLSEQAWYLDRIYRWLADDFVSFSYFVQKIDQKVIDPLVNGIGIAGVVFSKLLAIFDREIVDGVVTLSTWISKIIGEMLSRVQSYNVQTHMAWAALIVVMVFIWFQFL